MPTIKWTISFSLKSCSPNKNCISSFHIGKMKQKALFCKASLMDNYDNTYSTGKRVSASIQRDTLKAKYANTRKVYYSVTAAVSEDISSAGSGLPFSSLSAMGEHKRSRDGLRDGALGLPEGDPDWDGERDLPLSPLPSLLSLHGECDRLLRSPFPFSS